MRASLLLLLGLGCSQAQFWFTGADHTAAAKPKESPLEALLTRAQAMAGDNMGETGIGFCAGAATGIVCKKVQSTLVNTALIGAAVCAGACAQSACESSAAGSERTRLRSPEAHAAKPRAAWRAAARLVSIMSATTTMLQHTLNPDFQF